MRIVQVIEDGLHEFDMFADVPEAYDEAERIAEKLRRAFRI